MALQMKRQAWNKISNTLSGETSYITMTISEGDFFLCSGPWFTTGKKIWVVFMICAVLLLGLVGGGFCTLWERSLNIIQKKSR